MNEAIRADQVLDQLEALWSGLGSEEDGEVLRACAMTLLVLTDGPAGEAALAVPLAAVIPDHPSRVIVLALSDDAGRSLSASVSVRCWLAFGRRQQICCEQIDLSATRGALADLPPLTLALAAPDLPVAIWAPAWRWLGEHSLVPVLRLADKLIVDSAAAGDARAGLERVRALLAMGRPVGDLAWTRLTPWRAALAEAVEQPDCRVDPAAIERVEIRFGGGRAPSEAIYLAAWLESALGKAVIRLAPAAERFTGLDSLVLEGPSAALTLSRTGDGALELSRAGRFSGRLGRLPSEAELLAEELSLLERDPIFEKALEQALARLGGRH